jgi:BCD family chlorophyll transporter-like MFS transporter
MTASGSLRLWQTLGTRALPFADAASESLPLLRLLRLALFQVAAGMAAVLLTGTLNRVMVIELSIPAFFVAALIAVPVLVAPLRALVGHRSDRYRSVLGWRRVPFMWVGTLLQFGGLAIMPFSLLLLGGRGENAWPYMGEVSAALAFFLVGSGVHVTQTTGVALATELAPEASRPRVVALLYVMLLVGMVGASVIFGTLLRNFGEIRLIQVVQGAAVVSLALNIAAMWKQEPRRALAAVVDDEPGLLEGLRSLWTRAEARRIVVATGAGAFAFAMQDVLLEPFGAEVLGLSVSATTTLTAMMAGGTLVGLVFAARRLDRGGDPSLLAGLGALGGVGGFAIVSLSAVVGGDALFRIGVAVIGIGSGWFSVGALMAAMGLARSDSGLVVGIWGSVQATAAGVGVGIGGALRDGVSAVAATGALGPGLVGPQVGYVAVFVVEIVLLFVAILAIGPVTRLHRAPTRLGFAELPG